LGGWFGWRGREAAVPRTAAAVLAVWMAAEALSVAAPWKFFPHYFLVLLPPLSLLSGAALSAIVGRTVLPLLRPAAPCALAGVIALIPSAAVSGALLPALMGPNIPIVVISRCRARNVTSLTQPGAPVAIWFGLRSPLGLVHPRCAVGAAPYFWTPLGGLYSEPGDCEINCQGSLVDLSRDGK
jgi:hypothetical protein